ncbi:MAG: serine/threonine-protein kinase [Planctomycetota bacterium]|nr:serine/threonine-protein kinase [Planctomycetota bacterium]
MNVQTPSWSRTLSDWYLEAEGDLEFDVILERSSLQDDSDLADLIEADGRLRLHQKKPVSLQRYLQSLDDLIHRIEPLDAAIDMALRDLTRQGMADDLAVQRLSGLHPELEGAIRESAALNDALWSTQRLRHHIVHAELRPLPCGFGPQLDHGECRYELRRLLGEGSFGEVFVAVDRQLSEEDHEALVSIKIIAGGDGRSDWTRQQLMEEATKARRIKHPNVVGVIDRGVSDQDEDFIVYEYVDGGDLYQWSRREAKTRDLRDLVRIASKIALGVHAAHMAGLVHCDIKPSNIVLTAEGEPKVVDFGIAIRATDTQRAQTNPFETEGPMGNLAFMSPEQFRREAGALTIPSDIYALGGILFWLLTGKLPNGESLEEVRHTHELRQRKSLQVSLRKHRADIDRDLEKICQRAMATNPGDRYGSAIALAHDLESWLGYKPIAWGNAGAIWRLRLWIRRRPSMAIATGVIILLGVFSGFVIQHFVAEANQSRLNTAVEKARAEVVELEYQKQQRNLELFSDELDQVESVGLSFLVLQDLWLAEWMYGPEFLREGPDRFVFWNTRIERIRVLLEIAKNDPKVSLLRINIWQTSLAFWLVQVGDWKEAEPLIQQNYEGWSLMLDDEDPWLDRLKLIALCAAANRLTDSKATNRDLHEYRSVLEELSRYTLGFEDYDTGMPLHALTLDQLVKMYAIDEIGDPVRAEELRLKRNLLQSDLEKEYEEDDEQE